MAAFGISGEKLPVTTYGFNIPCRQFLVTANIAADRRLPVVDEFVLRVLKLCESVSVKRLAAYFGFTDREAEIVISDLESRGLVLVEGDLVSLHPSAHAHFRGTEDGSPRIIDIETWVERIWFDLVSRNMMRGERYRPRRNLIEIRPDRLARELPASFARKAFEDNFSGYLRDVRRIKNPDRFGLYSISDVVPGRYGFAEVKGHEDLIFDPVPRLRPSLLDTEVENLARFNALAIAMNDAYGRLTWPDASAAAMADFGRLLSDKTLAASQRGDGTFDLLDWLGRGDSRPDAERRPIFGAPYIERNMNALMQLINRRLPASHYDDHFDQQELWWFRPGGTGWGTSSDLQEAVTILRNTGRKVARTVRTCLIAPPVVRRERPQNFQRIFDEGFLAPAGYLSPSVEVLLLRGFGAIVVARAALSRTVSVFVGFATIDRDDLGRIEKALNWHETLPRAERLWEPQSAAEQERAKESELP